MLTLITFPPQFGQAAASPFCVKAIYLLNGSGLPWKREDLNDPRKMPNGKLPVLRSPERLIAGSDNIADYLAKHGTDLDANLDAQARATSHALTRMAEEHLYFLQALDRWERPEVWPIVRDAYFHEIPKLLRGVITGQLRKTMLKGMQSQGLGRLGWPERMARAEKDLSAISVQLGDKPFLFGETPTRADASIAPFVEGLAKSPGTTELSERVSKDTELMAWCARVDSAFGTEPPA